jgi:cell division protease FtsH
MRKGMSGMSKMVLARKDQRQRKQRPKGSPRTDDLHRLPDPTPPERSPNAQRPEPERRAPQSQLGSGCLWRWLLFAISMLLLWQVVASLSSGSGTSGACTLSYGTFYQHLQAGQVKDVTIQGDQATGTLKQPITCPTNTSTTTASFQTTIPTNDQTLLAQLDTQVRTTGLRYTVQSSSSSNVWLTVLINLLPWLLFGGLIFYFLRRAGRTQQNVFGFGKSRAKLITGDRPSTTFADVAGVEEAKAELQEVIEFLKTPEKFQRLGGKMPRGVLLVGPPGTGKTLLGRAVAGEAGVPFFSISGSEFVEMLVGVGASRVRDLFEQAKKSAPCIIFLDEIDAVGRQRGTSLVTNEEREQTLNQLLVEMDGFEPHQAVVVIAATNRPEGLDPALLRPGRFDRRVTVDRPDWKGRLAILEIHTRSVPLAPDVDLTQLARMTTGMVGADLANLVNEAALLAARRNLDLVDLAAFTQALEKIQLGVERPLVLSSDDLRVVAYHEGGHALVGLLTPYADPVTKVTIVPRGQTLGVTQTTPLDDRYNYAKEYLLARIRMALGGRAAEEVALGSITTGAEDDFQLVTGIARQMVMRWGMSARLGLVSFGEPTSPLIGPGPPEFGPRVYSEATAHLIDEEVHTLVAEAYEQVKARLRQHRATLDRIAQELRRHELLDRQQLLGILAETGVEVKTLPAHPGAGPKGERPAAESLNSLAS